MKVELSPLQQHVTLSQLVVGEVYSRHPVDSTGGGGAYLVTNNVDYPLVNLKTGGMVSRDAAYTYKFLHLPDAKVIA